jgi:hypothetical protein
MTVETSIAVGPQTWTEEEPTARLQWVERGDARILQQLWRVTTCLQVIDVTTRTGPVGEWRDVPNVD